MNRTALLATLLCLTAAAARADMATTFPTAATALDGASLQASLAGKVFRATDAKGQSWRLEYSRLGHLFVDIGTGFKDDGPYRVEGSQVCVTLRRSGASCAEYRADGATVYIRRSSNGEILKLDPQ